MSFELAAFIAGLVISKFFDISGETELSGAVLIPVGGIKGRALTRAEIESIIERIVEKRDIPASIDEVKKLAKEIYEWQSCLIEWRKIHRKMLRLETAYKRGRLNSKKYISSLLECEKELEEKIANYVLREDEIKGFCETEARRGGGCRRRSEPPYLEEILGRVAARSIIEESGVPLRKAVKVSASKVSIEEGVKWFRVGKRLKRTAVILEDLNCLVFEEEEGVLYLRKAKPREIKHKVRLETIKVLTSNFLSRLQDGIRNWRLDPNSEWSFQVRHEYSGEYRKVPSIVHLSAVLKEQKLIFGKTLLEIHVFVLTDADSLCRYGQAFKPCGLSDINRLLKNFKKKADKVERGIILCLASPTGWTPESVDFSESYSHPKLSLCLVDVKNGELYYNPKEELPENFIEILNLSTTRGLKDTLS